MVKSTAKTRGSKKYFKSARIKELKKQMHGVSGNDYMWKNIYDLMEKRGDLKRVPDIYKASQSCIDQPNLIDFWYWYKDKGWSEVDSLVCDHYLRALDKNKFSTHIDRTCLSGSDRFVKQLLEYSKCDLDIALPIYFDIVIKEVLTWNTGLLYRPNSLIGNYGWSVFIAHIDKCGGLANRFPVSDVKRVESDKLNSDLMAYNKSRLEALKRGDRELYDRMGEALVSSES